MITMILVFVLSLADQTPRRKRQGHDRNQQQLGGARGVALCVPSEWLCLVPTAQKREESTKRRGFRQETLRRFRNLDLAFSAFSFCENRPC
jgi:hypothetical protein